MEIKRPPILTVESSDGAEFEAKCSKLVEADYKLSSSSCGFVQSESYGFCSAYHAVFIDRTVPH